MRSALLAFLAFLSCLAAGAGDANRVFFPDLLPANAIACVVPPDPGTQEADYSGSVFHRLSPLAEMGPFLQAFEESRRQFAADIAQTAKVPSQVALELVESRLGAALLNLTIGHDNRPIPEFALALTLRHAADRTTIYSAVMELLNRPEVVRTVLESQPAFGVSCCGLQDRFCGHPCGRSHR